MVKTDTKKKKTSGAKKKAGAGKTVKKKSVKAAPKKTGAKGTAAKKSAPSKGAGKSTARKPATKRSFKKDIMESLESERVRLLKDLNEKLKSESDTGKFETSDIYDIASTERERELSLTLGDRERQRLIEIDNALERLGEKEYGLCEECSEEIGEERLRALPFTRLCIECKSKFERQNRVRARIDEPAVGMIDRAEPEDEEF